MGFIPAESRTGTQGLPHPAHNGLHCGPAVGKAGGKERWWEIEVKRRGQLFWSCFFAKFWHQLGAELWWAGLRPPQNRVFLLRAASGSTRFPGGFRTCHCVLAGWQPAPPKPCGVWSIHAQGSCCPNDAPAWVLWLRDRSRSPF